MFGAIWRLFKRIFKIGEAEANSALDKLENPIRMTEQGIRDLKEDLDKSLQSFAEVKAIAIRTRRETGEQQNLAADYESKARALLTKAQAGQMDIEEAKRLASEALARKEEVLKQAKVHADNMVKYDGMTANLQEKIQQLKSQIATWDNELRTLKARHQASKAAGEINKQLSGVDSSGTLAMLEKMREKVEQQEALAESYGEMANQSKSIDDEINKALSGSKGNAALDDLMKEMGMAPAPKLELEPLAPIEIEKPAEPIEKNNDEKTV